MSETYFYHNRLMVPQDPKSKPGWLISLILLPIFWPAGVLMLAARIVREVKAARYRKFRRYIQFFNGPDATVDITEVAASLNVPKSEVRDDIATMLKENMFKVPFHYSGDRNTLIFPQSGSSVRVDEERVRQAQEAAAAEAQAAAARYEAEKARADAAQARREAAEARRRAAAANAETEFIHTKPAPSTPAGAKGMTREQARAFVAPEQIRSDADIESILTCLTVLNDDIEHEGVSARIDRIASLSRDILQRGRDPHYASDVRRFMGYYLPTTLKLLQSYALLEEQSYQGDNITSARRDIETTLDSLIGGFEMTLDAMFSGEALDISSDVSVLETMLKKDGLTDAPSPFTRTAKDKGRPMPM